MSIPEPPWQSDPEVEATRQRLATPAVVLGVLGLLGLLGACVNLLTSLAGGSKGNEDLIRQLLADDKAARDAIELTKQLQSGPLVVLSAVLSMGAALFVMFGAWKMYRAELWGVAVAAAAVAVFPCTSPCCCCFGMPVGVWALVVLMDPKVQDVFGRRGGPPSDHDGLVVTTSEEPPAPFDSPPEGH